MISSCGDVCVLDCQRLISPNFAFMDDTKSSFSRLNCKDKNLWVSREPLDGLLVYCATTAGGRDCPRGGRKVKRDRMGVCVQGLKETTSGKAASPCWPLPQQQISQSEWHLHLVFTSDEVS